MLDDLPHVSVINIPDIVEGNFRGEPLYMHVDVCDFGLEIRKRMIVDAILNKIVVHLENLTMVVNIPCAWTVVGRAG